MASYIVNTPLKRPGSKKGAFEIVPPGKAVQLDEEDAQPLLDCGAIRKPDVIDTTPETPAS
jgi:hypothetical protein